MNINDFLFLLSIPKQDQESLSVPSLDCLFQVGARSWSSVFIQIYYIYRYGIYTILGGGGLFHYFILTGGFFCLLP